MPEPSEEERLLVQRRSAPPHDFPQQGALDWVRLGETSVNFTVNMLNRISLAKVEALTVVAGEAVGSQLLIPRIGEIRVEEALQNLKAFSALGSAMWFGFGVKHFVFDVTKSSSGLSCAALCACLTEGFSSRDSARILRELFMLFNPPSQIRPALWQWIYLVEACSGFLSATTFGVTIHQISRLCRNPDAMDQRQMSEPEAIAKALHGVTRVSTGNLQSIHVVGNADCAWIAAVAHWLLDLSVEIQDSSGASLYRPATIQKQAQKDPQVLITVNGNDGDQLKLVGQCFIVPSGAQILDLAPGDFDNKGGSSYGRVPWNVLLTDSFGKPMRNLIKQSAATFCGMALGCAARIFSSLLFDDVALPDGIFEDIRQEWHYVNSASHGKGFLDSARRFLPELSERLVEAMEQGLELDYMEATGNYENALDSIATICSCKVCSKDTELSDVPSIVLPYCQVVLTKLIIKLILILSVVRMESEIQPTRAGLEEMYFDVYLDNEKQGLSDLESKYPSVLVPQREPPLATVMLLFTGITGKIKYSTSAVSSGGLCFYLDNLVSVSAEIETCNLIHIVPGKIEWNGAIYKELEDINQPHFMKSGSYEAASGQAVFSFRRNDLSGPPPEGITHSLLIMEQISEGGDKLGVAHQMTSSRGRFLVAPAGLARKLSSALSATSCGGRECTAKPINLHCFVIHGEGPMVGLDAKPDILLLRILPDNVLAQWMALSQVSMYSAKVVRGNQIRDKGPSLQIVMQGKQCLRCAALKTVRGPRSYNKEHFRRKAVIVTT